MPSYHVTIFSTTCSLMLGVYAVFVGFFFFTYGAFTERKVVRNQIQVLLDDFTEDFIFFADQSDPSIVPKIGKEISKVKAPDLTEADKKVDENNSVLVKHAVIALSVAFVVCLLLSLGIWYFGLSQQQRRQEPYQEIVKRILVLMVIVMLLEFFFFTLVAGNYRPVDPNSVKEYLVESLQKYAET